MKKIEHIKVIILAGGFGTRLAEKTGRVPKPMVEVGGYPLLWHIIRMYAAHGVKEFIVALGYKGETIRKYFKKSAGRKKLKGLNINLVDTGLRTGTGGRLKRLKNLLGDGPFMVTYGDGLSDLNLKQLLRFHCRHGKLATVTAVRPPARFGRLTVKGDSVSEFAEKPQASEGWINGGFFVLEPEIFKSIRDEKIMFEQAPLSGLAKRGELMAYRHEGFWQCVDTLRDLQFLERLWRQGKTPWKIWKD